MYSLGMTKCMFTAKNKRRNLRNRKFYTQAHCWRAVPIARIHNIPGKILLFSVFYTSFIFGVEYDYKYRLADITMLVGCA